MKKVTFKYQNINFDNTDTHTTQAKLKNKILEIKTSLLKKYDSEYSFLYFDDQLLLKEINKVVKEKQQLKIDTLLLIGIGGSSLGTIAIANALGKKNNIKFIAAETIESIYTKNIYQVIESDLKAAKNILMLVISKSGKTTETIANASLFYDLLKKYKNAEANDYVVIITDKNSALDNLGKQNNIVTIHVPSFTGGRFSVLSAVGLFPLAFLGFDINILLSGAIEARDTIFSNTNEDALNSALSIFDAYKNGKNIHNFFVFNPCMESFGKWYRQLVGESLGKAKNLEGKSVNVGITPIVSVGSDDLHSVTQLYLAGPDDKITTFINIDNKADHALPLHKNIFSQIHKNLEGRTIDYIHNAIFNGTLEAFNVKARPFMAINLNEIDEYSIGFLLTTFMMQIVFLASLMNINPFDQPEVELYKIGTRKALARE